MAAARTQKKSPESLTEDIYAEQRPKTICLFKNRLNAVGFDEAQNEEPTQRIELADADYDEHGTSTVKLRFVRFQDVNTLSVVILDNMGGVDTTRIDTLRFYGDTVGVHPSISVVPTGPIHNVGSFRTVDNPLQGGFKHLSLPDLDIAIVAMQKTLECTPKNHPKRAGYLMILGRALETRFNRIGSMDDINNAVAMEEQAVTLTPDHHRDRAPFLTNLGVALQSRFERTGSMEDLNRAITMNEQSVKCTSDNHTVRAAYLNNLACALLKRFQRMEMMSDLDRTITMLRESIASTTDDHPDKPLRLNNLSTALIARFLRLGLMDDVNNAIKTAKMSISYTLDNHPHHPLYLSTLGETLRVRFERTGSKEDINRAIAVNEQALASLPEDHSDRPRNLSNLGLALEGRYKRIGLIEDLDRAVGIHEQALNLMPDDDHRRPTLLNNLGLALKSRFLRTGRVEDLDWAAENYEQSLKLISEDDPRHLTVLSNVGDVLLSRFIRRGSIADLDRAITMLDQALMSTPINHPDRPLRLDSLGRALVRRFQQTGSLKDLDRAITTSEQAVSCTPENHRQRPKRLATLAASLWNYFHRTGLIDYIDRAITIGDQAITLFSDDDNNRAGPLNSLGNSLLSRFQHRGTTDDLDRGVIILEQAVTSTPVDHPDRAMFLEDLGSALMRRFTWNGSLSDLNRAIMMKEQALALTPADHCDYLTLLTNLAVTLALRFDRTESMEDIDRAIKLMDQGVKSTPANHSDLPLRLDSLGYIYFSLFQLTESTNDLDQAIAAKKQAVESTPKEHVHRSNRLHNLGVALVRRYDKIMSPNDLDEAIEIQEEAVDSSDQDCSTRGIFLNHLAIALHSRYERTRSIDDLHRAVAKNEEAFSTITASPSVRLRAAELCALLSTETENYKNAKLILQEAVRILPMISPRVLKLGDQQHNISQFSDITSHAVSLSLADNEDPYKSLQLLELGRGILANLQLEVRSDISVLEASHPNLAQQFKGLRDRIDSQSSEFHSLMNDLSTLNSPSEPFYAKYRTINKEFDDIISSIRRLDGFENFLKGPTESELLRIADRGPIVVFNVSKIRSDAFLITTKQIRSVQLPLLTSATLEVFTTRFFGTIHNRHPNRYRHSTREINVVLGWLWDVAVEPILGELGYTQTPPYGTAWPRVWWVGSGLLGVLPIHAAGYHDSIQPQSALDRVISSYAPSLKSLSYALERMSKTVQGVSNDKVMIVSMPNTPEKAVLTSVETEVNYITRLFSETPIDTRVMKNPKREEVLSELPNYTIAHFACHGYSADDPSQSSLLLDDWKTVSLTVSDLTSLNIPTAKFAYLSACDTSAARNFELLDEFITLTSAVQLSGYPSVIGTLWQVADYHSAEVAHNVYAWMLEDQEKLDIGRSAEALHRAVRALRNATSKVPGITNATRTDPLVWASYIHVGV